LAGRSEHEKKLWRHYFETSSFSTTDKYNFSVKKEEKENEEKGLVRPKSARVGLFDVVEMVATGAVESFHDVGLLYRGPARTIQ
jgi:hypothetical protein